MRECKTGPLLNPEILRAYEAKYLKDLPREKMFFTLNEWCVFVGTTRDYVNGHMREKLDLPVRRSGNLYVVDKRQAARWLRTPIGEAWLRGRLRRRLMTADKYNEIVDFVREYG